MVEKKTEPESDYSNINFMVRNIQTSKEHLCFYLLHDFLSAQKLII